MSETRAERRRATAAKAWAAKAERETIAVERRRATAAKEWAEKAERETLRRNEKAKS